MARYEDDDDWRDAGPGGAYDGEVSIVVQEIDGERQAAFVPRGIGRMGEEGLFWMNRMQTKTMQLRELALELETDIRDAREAGMSWDSIGFCIGTTGEGARKRYGDG